MWQIKYTNQKTNKMKKLKVLIMIAAFTLSGIAAQAQKIKEGDKKLSFVKGQKKFNIEYSYEGMKVGKKDEAVYKEEKIAYYNGKQPGKGDKWAEKWVNCRSTVYQPMFEELINKLLAKGKTGATAAPGIKDAKYTIQVHTIMLEPGFNSYVMKVDPYCDIEITYVETSTGKVMAAGLLDNVKGVVVNDNDWDFDPSNRIKECYAKAGKVVGTSISKAIGK